MTNNRDHTILTTNDVAESVAGQKRLREKEILRQAPEANDSFSIFQNYPRWVGPEVTGLGSSQTLWDFKALDILKIWSHFGVRGEGINTYVVDSGVADHQSLAHQTGSKKSFLRGIDSPEDKNGHGTWVAGKIGAMGVGLAPRSRVHTCRVLDDSGTGSNKFTVAALEWILSQPDPHVVNLSLGGPVASSDLEKVIWKLQRKGVLIIAASGNLGSNDPFYPAFYDGLLSVGAVDKGKARAKFSNYGGHLDLVAPGVACYSTYLHHKFRQLEGTSMAAPTVAGLATLGASFLLKREPSMDRVRMRQLLWSTLLATATDLGPLGQDEEYGFGIVSGFRFMERLSNAAAANLTIS